MKRCPQCLFLYPESDVVCDFDQTPLEIIDDAEIDRATNRSKSRSKALPVAVLIGLIVGVIGFAMYYGLNQQTRKTAAEIQPALVTQPQSLPSPAEAALASPSPTIKPSPSPSPTSQPSSNKTAHTRATSDPISTSGPGMGTRQGAKPVILLASGGKIEADEAWRTKDGVWYRRNGMVTLLKRGQVKAIVTR
ncbi:MAG TPA: hypothetical protein VJW17_10840 [Pyrinomonadaceae bacterium]|nr:hypothetical protein [Pyrinomonadaceae bacterium]